MSNLVGKWKGDHSENMENFLKAMGVGDAAKKVAESDNANVEISVSDDGTWTIDTVGGIMKDSKISFKLGVPFEDARPGGKTEKIVATLEDGKLITKPVDNPDGPSAFWQVVDGHAMLTITKGDIIAKRFFNKA
ncbi:fatty acid-binding protein, heart-like [Ptychodera flava]|uniref:fatty acid-binding protein, heart-like n=1 Tax=Ptychodera flava TaxID=63121 RepID=UPI003969C8E8